MRYPFVSPAPDRLILVTDAANDDAESPGVLELFDGAFADPCKSCEGRGCDDCDGCGYAT